MDNNKNLTEGKSVLESEKAGKIGCAIIIILFTLLAVILSVTEGEKEKISTKKNPPIYKANDESVEKVKRFLKPDVAIVHNELFYTKSANFHNAYFVGANVKHKNKIKPCLWTINGDNLSGIVMSANDCAVSSSIVPDGRATSAQVSSKDDGYQRILNKLGK